MKQAADKLLLKNAENTAIMKTHKGKKGGVRMSVTQQQIANLAGVSRATVDRTLNNRGHVDPEVARRIQKIADELGYVPNKAGSLLQRAKRPMRLGVVIQSIKTPFMREVLEEIEKSKTQMRRNGAELLIYPTQGMDADMQLQQLTELEGLQVDGIAITPAEDERICDKINELEEKGISVVTFNSDMPQAKRLCYVGQNNDLSGRTCAGLMNMLLGGKGTILMVGGYKTNAAQDSRIECFANEIKTSYPGIALLPVEYCNETNEKSYQIVKETLEKNPDVNGLYFSASGPKGACEALREFEGRKVFFVCHDATRNNIKNIKDGYIDFIIDQNAYLQATKPIEILSDYILTGEKPEGEHLYTHIDILSSYNVD